MGDMHDYSGYGYYSGAGGEAASDQKNGTPGYDDQFNDGVARAALRTSSRQRPDQWPASASEMGRHVSYQDSGMGSDHDVAMLRSALSTSGRTRPDQWPKSASEMRHFVDFQEGQSMSSIDSAHLRSAGRGSAPPPSRGGWVYSLESRQWVRPPPPGTIGTTDELGPALSALLNRHSEY
jgi:hypothetical protein